MKVILKLQRGLEYYPNLVWTTLYKYRKRQHRFTIDKLVQLKETLVIDPYRPNP